jgi:hypothetical protein
LEKGDGGISLTISLRFLAVSGLPSIVSAATWGS